MDKRKELPLVQTETVSSISAEEFLNHLDPNSHQWGNQHEIEWVFRGHGDSTWPLVPSAWRANPPPLFKMARERLSAQLTASRDDLSKSLYGFEELPELHDEARGASEGDLFKILAQRATEVEIVADFLDMADELGYGVEDGPKRVLAGLQSRHRYRFAFFGPPLGKGTFWTNSTHAPCDVALAQHSGVPTRFLDWTSNPLAAVYFACESYLNIPSPERPKTICVWALKHLAPYEVQGISFDSPPRGNNNFQIAQRGLFTSVGLYDEALFRIKNTGKAPAIQDVLRAQSEVPSCLLNFTLPADQVSKLVSALWRSRVTKAHLMPSPMHIADALRMRIWAENGT